MHHRPIVIAGHSHANAFGFTGIDEPHGLIPLPELGRDVFGFSHPGGPYLRPYWEGLLDHAEHKSILLFWIGSQHLVEFLFEPQVPFDFIVASAPHLPLQLGTSLVPESLVRARYATYLPDLRASIERLLAIRDCQVYIAETPPPKGDDMALRELMTREFFFQQRAAHFGIDLETVPFTAPIVRLKHWLVIHDQLKEMAQEYGIGYISVPPETRDTQGFLRRKYWNEDVAHGNIAYGACFFNGALSQLNNIQRE